MFDSKTPILNPQVRHALIARHLSGWLQLVFLIVMFVLWRVMRWPFWTSAESCVVAGILLYSALNIYGALAAAWTGPALAARVFRFVAVVLYVVMRYALHYGFWKCLIIWVALWIVATYLVVHSRRRAAGATPVGISHLPPQ